MEEEPQIRRRNENAVYNERTNERREALDDEKGKRRAGGRPSAADVWGAEGGGGGGETMPKSSFDVRYYEMQPS